jgi:hypothetical protein
VAVRYDPSDPASSVLFPAPLSWTLWFTLASLFALGMALMFLTTAN